MDDGRFSLRELWPKKNCFVPYRSLRYMPATGGRAPTLRDGGETEEISGDRFRPVFRVAGFVKKTCRT